jgi:hypothetical protein
VARTSRSATASGLRLYLATGALPWFVLGAVLVIVGSFALHDPTESYVVVAGMVVLFAACVRYTVLAVRDDPLRSLMVARRGLLGWMATESAGGRRRRARQRAAAAEHEDAELHYEAPSTWK